MKIIKFETTQVTKTSTNQKKMKINKFETT